MTQGTARDIDLLGFGVAAVDELIELDEHPPRDVKIDLRSHETQAGGICVNALAAAARLGLRCHFAGPLGRNTLSDVVRRGMSGFGITFEPPHRCDDAGPSHAFILVDRATGSRTILMNKARVIDLRPGEPDASLIARARAMYVDAWHLDAGLDAVRTARARGVITVADFEEHDPERVRLLLPSIDHLILPAQYATRLTGETDPVAAIARLSPATRACTAVTIGADGAWFATGADPDVPRRQAAFAVDPVDTTGCGDAFHGAYITAILRGSTVAAAMRYGAAAAALNTRSLGAQAGLPTHDEVIEFIRHATPLGTA